MDAAMLLRRTGLLQCPDSLQRSLEIWRCLLCILLRESIQGRSPRNGLAAGLTLIWPGKLGFDFCSAILGLWDVRWRATWILTILTFQGGAIRAIRTFCRGAGCRNPNLLGLIWGRLQTNCGSTLGQLWADSGPIQNRSVETPNYQLSTGNKIDVAI